MNNNKPLSIKLLFACLTFGAMGQTTLAVQTHVQRSSQTDIYPTFEDLDKRVAKIENIVHAKKEAKKQETKKEDQRERKARIGKQVAGKSVAGNGTEKRRQSWIPGRKIVRAEHSRDGGI